MTRKRVFFFVAMVLVIGLFPVFGQTAQGEDKILKIAVGLEVYTIDLTQYNGSADRVVGENWFELMMNKETNGEVTPGLVTSWKMAPDGKKMEFTLRKGVKFHSGDLLTAKDVVFSLERAKAKSPMLKRSLASVARAEIVDDYHFNIYFKTPDVLFLARRGGEFPIASKSYYDRVGEETFSKQPSGTGPYKMVTYKPGEYIDLERFEGYWGKKPSVKKARIYFVGEDTTRVAKLMAGEVDLITAVSFPDVKSFKESSDFKIVKLDTRHPTRGIVFGVKNPKVPWHDKRVRLAMAHAIDCRSIIHNILNDIPNEVARLFPGELGYDPTIKPYGYDPKKAKALLAEAGYPDGFEMKLYWPSGGRVPMSREIVEAVSAYFEAVGIRTKLMGMEQAAFVALHRKNALDPNAEYVGYYQAGVCGGVDPTNPIGTFFTSKGGFAGYSNPKVDKLNAEAQATMDDGKRAKLIKEAVRIIHDDVASVPIFSSVAVYGMKKSIDFTPTEGINFEYVLVKDMKFK